MIPRETVDKIIQVANITEVVGDYVSLKRRGTNYLGLCPFHNEKTPSFIVSPAKGIFKCFGCGKGGNAVNFVMEHDKLSYPEALKILAKKYNIPIEEREESAEEIKQKNERESLLIVVNWSQKYFTNVLLNTDEGKSVGLGYFKKRQINAEIIEKFQLGYSPEKRDALTEEAQKNGYKSEYLITSGLTIEKNKSLFDRFAGRVIFPIHNVAGKVIAFGGRTLRSDKNIAKYLNSPESEIYHKSDVLYGIFQAKNAINQLDKCYMVEGYTDVLAMHQAGIYNVVASSGTSLTPNQIRLVKRFTQNLTIIYDGDQAGIKASLRGIDLVLEEDMNVKVLLLPDGEDPDSFSKNLNHNELKAFINENEVDFIVFKLKLLLKDAESDPLKRSHLITDIVRSISIIPNSITRSVYIKECSNLLDISEQALYSENVKQQKTRDEKKINSLYGKPTTIDKELPKTNLNQNNCELFEKELVRILLNYGNSILFTIENRTEIITHTVASYILTEIAADFESLKFTNQLYMRILAEFTNDTLPDSHYFISPPDFEISTLAADMLSSQYSITFNKVRLKGVENIDLKKLVFETINSYKEKKILLLIKEIDDKMKQADENLLLELMQRKMALNELKKLIAKELSEKIIL